MPQQPKNVKLSYRLSWICEN